MKGKVSKNELAGMQAFHALMQKRKRWLGEVPLLFKSVLKRLIRSSKPHKEGYHVNIELSDGEVYLMRAFIKSGRYEEKAAEGLRKVFKRLL